MIFDLDGTLIDTDFLKGRAYVIAVRQMLGYQVDEGKVIDVYSQVVGQSHKVVSTHIAQQFGAETQWEVLSTLKRAAYQDLLKDETQLRARKNTPIVDLVRRGAKAGYTVAIGTSASTDDALHVLSVLGLGDSLSAIVTSEQVMHHKPHPEVYLRVADQVQSDPSECLVFEDTLVGAQAALSAGMHCIAVPNALTVTQFENQHTLVEGLIAWAPDQLAELVNRLLTSSGASRII
jgi:beta-phosphoglucomutase-like phosphatase (HAD superfamily)